MTLTTLLPFCLICQIFPENLIPETRSGKSASGKEYTIRTQKGYYKKPSERFPRAFKFPLQEGATPYGEGHYFIDPNSFGDGDYDTLEINRYDFRLVPVPVELHAELGIAGKK